MLNQQEANDGNSKYLTPMVLGHPIIEIPKGRNIIKDTLFRKGDGVRPDTSSEWKGSLLEELEKTGEYAGISHAQYLITHQDDIPEAYRDVCLAFLGTIAKSSDYHIIYMRWDGGLWVSHWDYPIFALCPRKYPHVVFLRLIRK